MLGFIGCPCIYSCGVAHIRAHAPAIQVVGTPSTAELPAAAVLRCVSFAAHSEGQGVCSSQVQVLRKNLILKLIRLGEAQACLWRQIQSPAMQLA